jgi:cytochrome c-type biogenesis protein CcmH
MPRADRPTRGLRRAISAVYLIAALLVGGLAASAMAKEAAPATDDPVLEARMMRLSSELRCLVCQNETIAASNAELAVDLKNQVREMMRNGKTDAEILQYMTARYGDFVLFRPPLKSTTWLLWFGPALLLVGGAAVLLITLRRRNRLGAEHFEPDAEDGEAAPSPNRSSLSSR